MRFLLPTTFSAFVLFLSGCVYVNNEEIEKQFTVDQINTVASSTTEEWLQYMSTNGEFTFQYPKNIMSHADSSWPLSFDVSLKQNWEDKVKAEGGTNPFDGKCEDLDDFDCIDYNWIKQYEEFTQAVAGKGSYGFFGEASLIKENVQIINGLTFIVGIDIGINGSCDLHYVTYKNNTQIEFVADICDDEFFRNFDFRGDYWSTGKFPKEIYTWAEDVINGKSLDATTDSKIDTLLKVIATIE